MDSEWKHEREIYENDIDITLNTKVCSFNSLFPSFEKNSNLIRTMINNYILMTCFHFCQCSTQLHNCSSKKNMVRVPVRIKFNVSSKTAEIRISINGLNGFLIRANETIRFNLLPLVLCMKCSSV